MKKRFIQLALFLIGTLTLFSCHPKIVPADGVLTENSREAMKQDYVILVSCDGFRWDYVQRFQPPNLMKFIAEGVQAESMTSCFPSKTFPNHYSIATGMYPDHHGIVGNGFYDPARDDEYRLGNREKVEDGTWYGGTPIWVQAIKSGMISASYFFVGSEAAVQGIRPTYYFRYDGSVPNDRRVEQVLDWLKLPEKKRPHIITLYFSDMDNIGHRYGPNADDKLREGLLGLDATFGKLFEGVKQTGLPVNIIIVSDHGMLETPNDKLLPTDLLEHSDRYRFLNGGATAHFYLKEGADAGSVLKELQLKEDHFRVYHTKDLPLFETPPTNPRWGDLMAIPDSGYYFMSQRIIDKRKSSGKEVSGEHGFDPAIQDMHGIFYANGPAFKKGLSIGEFKNINVYPLICHLLGLDVPKDVDGKLEVLKNTLQ